jgi:hypothetical protein
MIKEIPSAEEGRKETICEGRGEKIQIMEERNNLSVADRYIENK